MIKNTIYFFIILFSLSFLGIVSWGIYSLYFSSGVLVKVPLANNIFIAKNVDNNVSGEILFQQYIFFMSGSGYKYLPDERMGRFLVFEKDGGKVFFSYPKFIHIKKFLFL